MKSVWNIGKTTNFNALVGDRKTDVLIIGGGISGILCAYMLKNAGVDCVLLEANAILSGITKNTTAKITCQHGLIYSDILSRYGKDTAKLYYNAQKDALRKYEQLIRDIDCDFEKRSSYAYTLKDKEKLEKELDALGRIGAKATFCPNVPLPFSVLGAIEMKNQAQFNPFKFLCAIAHNLPIYEKTKVLELTKNGAITNHGKIKADKIIVATHFPLINKHGGYFLKMFQERSYVIALKNAPLYDGMYVDESKTGMSFRTYKDMLLLGGGGHRTGKQGGAWKELLDFKEKNYPDAKEVTRWATQDCMTLDNIPYIGRYSKNTPELFVATGFNKWGMTSSMVAATVLKDLVQGKKNEFCDVFSPQRSIFHPQLAINIGEALKGILSPTTPRCPHLGCALKYNSQEHSWDCSCHGSRFTKEGELIDNPATDDIKIKSD